jgi:hypothetical protein
MSIVHDIPFQSRDTAGGPGNDRMDGRLKLCGFPNRALESYKRRQIVNPIQYRRYVALAVCVCVSNPAGQSGFVWMGALIKSAPNGACHRVLN